MISVSAAYDLTWKHFQGGRWQQAEELCHRILEDDRTHVDALHLLGVLAAQTGRDDLAIGHFHGAIRLKPDFAAAHNNLGNVFKSQRKLPEAVACFREAARLKPDHGEPHNN